MIPDMDGTLDERLSEALTPFKIGDYLVDGVAGWDKNMNPLTLPGETLQLLCSDSAKIHLSNLSTQPMRITAAEFYASTYRLYIFGPYWAEGNVGTRLIHGEVLASCIDKSSTFDLPKIGYNFWFDANFFPDGHGRTISMPATYKTLLGRHVQEVRKFRTDENGSPVPFWRGKPNWHAWYARLCGISQETFSKICGAYEKRRPLTLDAAKAYLLRSDTVRQALLE